MTTTRLENFAAKTTPVDADIIYIGDSADSFNEVKSTISQVISNSAIPLKAASNLSDVASASTSRTNLSVPKINSYAGDPNSHVAGVVGDLCLNTSADDAYICTTAGIASAAVWTLISVVVPGSGSNSCESLGATTAAGNSFAIGYTSTIDGTSNYSMTIGDSNSTTNSQESFAFGSTNTYLNANSNGTGGSNYILGSNNINTGNSATLGGGIVLIGAGNANTNGHNSMVLGHANTSTATQYSYILGYTNTINNNYQLTLGGNITANATYTNCVFLNDFTTLDGSSLCTANNQLVAQFSGGYRFYGSSINVLTVGKGLAVKEGSNCKQGTVTLVSGVGVVSNNSVTDNSRIFYCGQDTNVTGFLTITARSTGSGFTITSSVLSDSGVVAYQIFEPAQ